MDKKAWEKIKSQTTNSVIFLSLRNFGLQGISLIGFFLLTLLLGPSEVGLFAIVAETIAILSYFSDVGLASALIQQKDEVKKEDLQTTFIIQQILVIGCLAMVAIFYPQIAKTKSYGSKEIWILISLCYSFFIASLKTIPSVLLERKLDFKVISTIDIFENLTFYIFAVMFAFFGFGAYSYAIAVFIRSTLGLILIYKWQPWSIGFSFSKDSAKKLFKFGIPFQLNSFIAMAKDRLSNILVAGIVGRNGFGYLSWGQKAPRLPLGFMDAIMRVTFPTFSRIQEKKDLLSRSLSRSIFFIAFFSFPLLAGIVSVAADLTSIIPKYEKWTPALIPLYFYAANAAIALITTPLTNAFNATGKILTTTKFMIMWTVLTWILFPLLSIKYGYIGTSVATLLVGLSSFVVWFVAQKEFKINIIKQIFHPLISSILILLICSQIKIFIQIPIYYQLIIKIISSLIFYSTYQWIFSKDQILWFATQIKIIKKND